MPDSLPIRLGLQQRVLPAYRVPFFDALAAACTGGLGVFAGQPRPQEMIESRAALQVARYFPAVNRHWFDGSFYLCWQSGFFGYLNTWQPQALVVEANPRYPLAPWAVAWMHARRRPVIGWGLGAPPSSGVLAGLRRLGRISFLRQFDALVAYSRQGAASYAALGFPPGRIFVAPNAVAARPTQPPPRRPPLPDGPPALLFVGRLQARKRLDLLFQACAALPPVLQPRVWVVGDGPARAELETLANTIYPGVVFYGARHGPDLAEIFEHADLFVLPGTGGLAVQQAMSYALPVIVAEADGTQADLVRPANGWAVSPGSQEGLLAALLQALGDLPSLRRMGAESFRIVSEEVNLEAMVAGFSQAVASLNISGIL